MSNETLKIIRQAINNIWNGGVNMPCGKGKRKTSKGGGRKK